MKKFSTITIMVVSILNLLTNIEMFLKQSSIYDSLCHRIQNNRELSLDIYDKIKLGEENERCKKMDKKK